MGTAATNPPRPRLAAMLSGAGRTFLNLLESCEDGRLHASMSLVITSRECPGADRARAHGITTVVAPGLVSRDRLSAILAEHAIDLVALAGYLRRLEVPAQYRDKIVNIHPALLPDFGGPGMYGERVHAAVLSTGRGESGCTVHFVDDRYDTGAILAQQSVSVMPGDTVATLAARVFAAECDLYPRTIDALLKARTG